MVSLFPGVKTEISIERRWFSHRSSARVRVCEAESLPEVAQSEGLGFKRGIGGWASFVL